MAAGRPQQIRQALANARPVQSPTTPRWDNSGKWNVAGAGAVPAVGQGRPAPRPAQRPAARAPQQPTGSPWDSISTLEAGGVQQNYANKEADLAAQQAGAENAFGLNPGYDVNNPYSQAALLEAQHVNARRGAYQGGAQNALYSGSTINHLNEADNRYNVALNTLKERQSAELAKIQSEEQNAYQEAQEGINSASLGAAGRLEKRELQSAPAKRAVKSKGSGKKKR